MDHSHYLGAVPPLAEGKTTDPQHFLLPGAGMIEFERLIEARRKKPTYDG